jgi:hypothetical protein
MRDHIFVANLVLGALSLTVFSSAPLTFAVAHEAHHMECSETAANAMNADIQSMRDEGAKATAMKEMEMAEEMMAKKDMKACMTHMHNAMKVMEE